MEELRFVKMGKISKFESCVHNVKHNTRYIGLDEKGEPMYNDNELPRIKFIGTVKMHGTQAGVVQNGARIHSQSNRKILGIEGDNAGFNSFVKKHIAEFEEMFKQVRMHHQVLKNEIITIYGEWCGPGIQSGMGINKMEDKFMVIFGIKISTIDEEGNAVGKMLEPNTFNYIQNPKIRVYNIYDFQTYEIEIDFNNLEPYVEQIENWVNAVAKECPVAKKLGNISGNGEGIVFIGKFDGNRYIFKSKIDVDAIAKDKIRKVKVKISPEKLDSIKSFVEYACNEDRLSQMFKQIKTVPKSMTDLGGFLKSVSRDIIDEEILTLEKSNLEWDDVKKQIPKYARDWFIKNIMEV